MFCLLCENILLIYDIEMILYVSIQVQQIFTNEPMQPKLWSGNNILPVPRAASLVSLWSHNPLVPQYPDF